MVVVILAWDMDRQRSRKEIEDSLISKGLFVRRMVSETKFYKVLEILSCARGCPKYIIDITFVELRLVS